MDAASGVVLRQPLRLSSSAFVPSTSKILKGTRRRAVGIKSSNFCDQGHVKYYNSNFTPTSSMTKINEKKEKAVSDKSSKKMKKKQLKLVKGLSRDLSTFSQIGFGLETDGGLVDQVKGNIISEATELLLEQLQKLKADKKELKRKMKEEKARLKAATRMRNCVNKCEMSSSSSSSESSSSDSECGEIVDMNNLKRAHVKQSIAQQVSIEEPTPSTYPIPILPPSEPNIENKGCSEIESNCRKTESLVEQNSNIPTSSKKIEVCMGGKCKKSGGGALLEEFQRVVGIEGAVSGCKCMGKCRDGPNVKVLNGFDGRVEDSSVRAPANNNSLCIGVGLEDVDVIVANFLGENNHSQVGFAPAC